MTLLANQPLLIPEIWVASLRLWRNVFKKIWPLVLVALVWLVLPYFLLPELNDFRAEIWIQRLMDLRVGLLFYLLVAIIFYAAIYYRASKVLLDQQGGFWSSLLVGVKKLPVLILAMILNGFLVGLGYVALVLPGIFLTVALVFYSPLIIIENANPFTSLKDCIELIWGNWWRTAAVIGIPSFLFFVVSVVIENYGASILKVPHPLGGDLLLFRHVSKFILGVFYFPFFVTLVLVQLNDLKLRKAEGVISEEVTPK